MKDIRKKNFVVDMGPNDWKKRGKMNGRK